MAEAAHISVMPDEVMEALHLPAGGAAVDGTLGLGGHALRMARILGPSGVLIGIDRDAAALTLAQQRLAGEAVQKHFLHGRFFDIDALLHSVGVKAVDGILLDLGISSFQLDDAARGFSFGNDGPLDMRMDQSAATTAADLVNRLPEKQLADIIFEYGEERFAKRIARTIVQARAEAKILRTSELARLVLRSLPGGYTRGRIHPATRTFQALRIAVNEELEHLGPALEKCRNLLKEGGRLCVISFHSLEDRIVKTTFRRWGQEGLVDVLTKKPLKPTEGECAANPRSRSACLRAVHKHL